MAYGFILVVEDDRLQRDLYVDALRANGYEVASADSGEQVLPLLARRVPRLIILDINLPKFGGFEICRRIRIEFGTSITVIFFTSSDRLSVLQQGIEAGGDDFLIKGVGIDGMLERVSFWMNARSRSLERSQRETILRNVKEAISTGDAARLEAGSLALARTGERLDSAVDENLAILLRFVREARGRAPPRFGHSIEQKLYLLGYVTGAVNHLANSSLLLKIRFIEYLKATLGGASILEHREIDMLVGNWHSLYSKPTFGAACHRGGDEFQAWRATAMPPVGLQEFAAERTSELVGPTKPLLS